MWPNGLIGYQFPCILKVKFHLKEVIMNSVCIIILLTKLIALPPNGWASIDEIFYEVIFIIVLGNTASP